MCPSSQTFLFQLSKTEHCWDTHRKSQRGGSSCCVWISDTVHMALLPDRASLSRDAKASSLNWECPSVCFLLSLDYSPAFNISAVTSSVFSWTFILSNWFCSSYSHCHLLQVLESRLGRGSFHITYRTFCSHLPLLPPFRPVLPFGNDKPSLPGSRRQSPASLGGLG